MRLVGGMVGAAIGMIVIDGYDDGLLQMSMPTNQALMVGVIGALAGYNYDTVRDVAVAYTGFRQI